MLVRARHIRQIVREHTEVRRSAAFDRSYKASIRMVLLLVTTPTMLVLLMCILHIPILPVFGMFVMLWVLLRMSNSIAELAFRWLWPLHSRLLLYQNPDRTDVCQRRLIKESHTESWVELDEATGEMKVGLHETWDLLEPYTLGLERAEDTQGRPQLRLRMFQDARAPLVIGIALSLAQEESWGDMVMQLDRHEGDVHLMDAGAFREFVTALRRVHASSTTQPWPPLLDRFARPRAAPPLAPSTHHILPTTNASTPAAQYALRERREPQRRLSDSHVKLSAIKARHEVDQGK